MTTSTAYISNDPKIKLYIPSGTSIYTELQNGTVEVYTLLRDWCPADDPVVTIMYYSVRSGTEVVMMELNHSRYVKVGVAARDTTLL